MKHALGAALWAAIAIATLAGCHREPHQAVGAIEVARPWVRAMAPHAPAAGGFMALRNTGDAADRLLSVSSAEAERVEIHEVVMDRGVMRMRPLASGLALPAGATVELQPGGYHLMLIGPRRRFAAGEEVAMRLVFARAGTTEVRFAVRPLDATSADGAAHH